MIGLLALLRRIRAERPDAAPPGTGDPQREAVRLRAAVHLGFAADEVAAATPPASADGRWDLELNLPALIGPGSPLPASFTERMMPDRARPARALIDAVDHRLLSLQVRVALGDRAEDEATRSDRLARLLGVPERADLLRWSWALCSTFVGTCDLAAALADACAPVPVRLEPCVEELAALPTEARARLGSSRLGVDTTLGEEVRTRATAFAVVIGPVDASDAAAWTPGGERRRQLDALIGRANPERLTCRVTVLIDGASLPVAQLGATRPVTSLGRLAGAPLRRYAVAC